MADANHGTLTVVQNTFVRKLQLKYGGPFVPQLRAREALPTDQVIRYSETFSSKDQGIADVSIEVCWINNTCLGVRPVTTGGKPLSGSNACTSWQSFDHPLGLQGKIVRYRLTALGGFGEADQHDGGYNIFVQRHVTSNPGRSVGHTSGLRNFAKIRHEMFEDMRAFWFLPNDNPGTALTLLRGMTTQEVRDEQHKEMAKRKEAPSDIPPAPAGGPFLDVHQLPPLQSVQGPSHRSEGKKDSQVLLGCGVNKLPRGTPRHLSILLEKKLENVISDKTHSTYKTAQRWLVKMLGESGMDLELPVPVITICIFAVYLEQQGIGRDSIRHYLDGISFLHLSLGFQVLRTY